MKKLLILGSTGSIGQNACSVVREFKNDFIITGLSTNIKTDIIIKQIEEFKPKAVYVESGEARERLLNENKNIKIYDDSIGLQHFVDDMDFDILINALTGYAGFLPTISAVKKGKTVALANKESLVVGGDIVYSLLKEHGANIIPIDSEHSAIFQILSHFKDVEIKKIILTASGGPFLNTPKDDFIHIKVEDALKHPTWAMGKKITIDSATMMNKGFEVIEAHYLFNLPYEKIDTIIHPQSVVHSLVEFVDGEIYAQLGKADMRLPIQNALTYPHIKRTPFGRLNLLEYPQLNFYRTDLDKFMMLKLAYECGKKGGVYPCMLNAANEICVEAFLNRKISFLNIFEIVKKICKRDLHIEATIENIIKIDSLIRKETFEFINLEYFKH